jgi:hypothetical protein
MPATFMASARAVTGTAPAMPKNTAKARTGATALVTIPLIMMASQACLLVPPLTVLGRSEVKRDFKMQISEFQIASHLGKRSR